ncbi:hypothetical protein CVT24_007120 [Panaeolus cyanescens]|uniref:Uncharacterized protein n=1 Tax=Panaeolus cyanescens TaxID=181874 RepID=A0A409VK18_9AGAR|nr:hypothetical protein CVT24_007120 [Panaeolus cyanescens]
MSSYPKVLVVGCGPAGLAAALTLAQNGVAVRIIEKDASPRVGQRGAGITPRSLELFEALGVLEEIQQKGRLVMPVRSYRSPGDMSDFKEFTMMPKEDPMPKYPYRNFILLGQDGLDKVMRAKLSEYGCSVDYGTELVSLEQKDDQVKVVLQVRNGICPEAETSRVEEVYEYVIGTDGAKGVVRKQLGLQFLGDNLEIGMAIGDLKIEGLSEEYWHMWGKMEDSLFVGIRATENPGVFNFMLGGSNFKSGKELCQDHDLLRAFLKKHSLGDRENIKIVEVICASSYTPTVRMVDVFGKNNVFVAGDAAHVHSPAGAQGMNTGLQDGFNIAWKMAMVCKGWAPKTLLETYNEERFPVVAQMLNITSKLMKAMATSSGDESGWKRTGNGVNQLGVNYRWSSIVVNERSKPSFEENKEPSKPDSYSENNFLRAGDRAPDAPGLRSLFADRNVAMTRLFTLFSPARHTLLVFSSSPGNIRRVLDIIRQYPSEAIKAVVIAPSDAEVEMSSRSYACDVYVDFDGHAYDAYTQTEYKAVAVVVRPDGFIGAIVETVERLAEYFSGMFVVKNV